MFFITYIFIMKKIKNKQSYNNFFFFFINKYYKKIYIYIYSLLTLIYA